MNGCLSLSNYVVSKETFLKSTLEEMYNYEISDLLNNGTSFITK